MNSAAVGLPLFVQIKQGPGSPNPQKVTMSTIEPGGQISVAPGDQAVLSLPETWSLKEPGESTPWSASISGKNASNFKVQYLGTGAVMPAEYSSGVNLSQVMELVQKFQLTSAAPGTALLTFLAKDEAGKLFTKEEFNLVSQ